ncbi:MAG: DEAD/DEAH box helicase [Mogibacterium sp.]|nr:DEAD/DEAH box helicase [Mogibacterium sp.]
MNKDFNSKEAKSLILRHQALISKLRLTEKESEKWRKRIGGFYEELVESGEIEALVDAEIKMLFTADIAAELKKEAEAGQRTAGIYDVPPTLSPALRDLIIQLFQYRKFAEAEKKCRSLETDYVRKIEKRLEELKPAAGTLRWLFTSRVDQQRAINAFDFLSRILDTRYPDDVALATQILDESHAESFEPSFENAFADLRTHSKSYRSALLAAIGDRNIDTARPVSACAGLLSRQEQLDQLNKVVFDSINDKRGKIKDAANDYIHKAALRILNEVPVEELNHHGAGGIRVKLLRDKGMTTMADVYKASHYKLKIIKGISNEGASEIKRIAELMMMTAQNAVRIRLNADDQNKEATEIVKAVCPYRKIRPQIEKVLRQDDEYGEMMIAAAGTIRKIGNGTEWLFYSAKERSAAIDAMRVLAKIQTGDHASILKEAHNALLSSGKVTKSEAWKDFVENTISYYTIIESIVPGVLGDDSGYGLPEELAEAIKGESLDPEGLRCDLRPYQVMGVKYILHQKNVLLGDEMGLGKTIEAIATMVCLRNTGATHFLVVCPASVLSNWCREIHKHSDLKVTRIHGADKESAIRIWKRRGGVAVTTYETTGHFNFRRNQRLDLLVVDEAHYIKNSGAQRTKNVRSICEYADRLLFMTGTALENRVDEMISLVSVLQPATADSIRSLAFMSTAPQFRTAAAPVYYRRKRDDVLQELPDLIETEEWCEMGAEEERAYEEAVLSRNFMEVRRVSWNVDDLNDSSKAKRLKEIIEEAREDGRKVIVFSFFLDTIDRIRNMLGNSCYGPINGSVSPDKRQQIIDEFERSPDGSVLVSQIMSGGTGLNIQAASVVVICEPQFKPSTENQAISRAYRMGQSRNVQVFRLLCESTVDEKLTEMLANKQAVFDAFADRSAAAEESFAIDSKTFAQIIEEEIERIKKKHMV